MQNNYLMPNYARQAVSFVRGQGMYLWDAQGNQYLDAIAGVAVTNLGHSHPEISQVISQQAQTLLHTSNMFAIGWQQQLAEKLCQLANMDAAFFANSGAEANEAALKLARLHAKQHAIGHSKIVVMENSFHGRTLATLAATDHPAIKQDFAPFPDDFIRVPYNDIAAISALIGKHPIAAVLLEPIQGEGGVHCASNHYLQALRKICDEQNWLLMLDEVQTGIGRTGHWFAHQASGIVPDVMTLAKALGNGLPIGACLAKGKAAQLFTVGAHASTFGGNHFVCRTACKVLEIIQRDQLLANAQQRGQQLLHSLQEKLARHPQVLAIRGQGLMLALELKQDASELVSQALQEQRLLISVTRQKTIRLLPALICTEEQTEQIAQRLAALFA